MRKFLLFAIATMMSVAMMAAGSGDGTSKANAIDFDWTSGHEHVGTKWYRVDLSEIDGMVDPTLALYLTNMSDVSTEVTMSGSATISISVPGFSYSKDTTMSGVEYTIDARDYKLWSQNVKQLLDFNVRYLHLELSSAQSIYLSAKKYETSEIVDLACEDADDFDWSGVQVEAGEKWYRLNLAAVKAQNQKLNFVVANQGSQDATVAFDLSLDCPASVVFGYNWTIPAGGEITEEFGRVFIDELKEDYVYLKLNTNQALNLRVEEVPAPAPKDETWAVADVLTEGQAYTFSGEHIFEVPMATLGAPRGMKAEFVITNNTGVDAVLTKQISFANPVKTTIDKELTVAANATVTKEVVNNMAGVINSQTAYIRFNATQELTVQLNYVVVNEEVMNAKPVEIATCEKSQLLDWNSTIKQSGLETKWYEIDLSTIKQNDEHLQLTFTNKSNNIVVVMGEILRACKGDTVPYICPVPVGMSVSQVINYNMFALLQYPDHFYISATVIPTTATSIMEFKDVRSQADLMKFVPKDLSAIQDAEVELTANTISALVDPAACNQATTIASGVKYEQAAGTTQWYRVTDELLNKLLLIPDVAFINNGKQAANVTLAASVDCEHSTFGMSTFSLPTWADLTVFPIRLLGDMLDKALNEDVKEMYLQVTTDQPIAFGIDIDYGFGLGCDDAREFDWAKGAVINKGDAQWLSFDITSVKENKQQVRLTLTNESNSLAWVAMLTSLTCPFDVALPMVFAIPAGMSIDKVVDYSYFAATKLDQLYVALITEETISVKAVAEKSQASASDYAACANAVEVKNGEAYVQKAGTTWYKFDRSLFSDVSRLPKFRYAAEATTSLTMGVTVGCEYNIATRGTIKLPTTKGLEVSFRMPGFIYDVLDKFVHDDVEAVYVEMTTDQQIKFGIDMEYAGGCEKATKLDLSQPLDIDLTANKDVWYYLDLKDVRAMGDEKISFRLNNQSDKSVEVEFEVTPTCPLVVSAIKSVDVPAGVDLPLMVRASAITDLYDQVVAKFDVPDKIANNLPEQLTDDLIYYVRVRANGDLTVDTDTIPETPDFVESCKDADLLDWTKTIELSNLETGWYKLNISSLRANKQDFTLSLNNNTGDVKKLRFFFYEDCSDIESELENLFLTSLSVTAPMGLTTQKVPYAALNYLLGDDVDEFYVYLEIDGGELNEACLNAMLLDDPNVPHTIQLVAGKEQWFKVATNALEKLQYNLKVSVDAEVSDVTVSVSSSCLVEPIIDTTVVLGNARHEEVELSKSTILDKWSKYSSKVSDIDTAYVRVLSTGNITLITDTVSPTPPADPDACENATLLDWTQTVNLSSLTTGWYKFDISSLHASQSDFTLSLNNDMGETKAVEMTLYLSCDQPYEAKTTQVFPVGITTRQVAYSLLTQVVGSADMVYVYIKTDIQVPVIPEADACLNAIELTWNDTLNINAGDTTWYMLPLAEAKALGKDLTLTVINSNDADANVYVAVAETCPVLAYLTERTGTVPANMTISRTLSNSELTSLADTVYFRLSTTQDLTIVAGVAIEEPEQPEGCENAILLDWTKTINLSDLKTGWYKFDISSVHTANKDFTLSLNNDLGEAKNLGFRLYKDCDSPMMGETVMTFPVGITSRTIPANLLSLVDGIDMLYVYLIIDAPLPCEGAILFDWNKGAYQEADKTKWYEFDITPVLEQEKQVKLTFTNHSNENAWVIAELAFHCPYTKSIPIIVPVPANMSVDKWIDYSAFEASRIEHFYMGVTTRETAIELAATWEDARVAPSEGCMNATLVKNDSLYEHAAGTHWYKFTGDLFDEEGHFSRIRVVNRSAKTVNITAGGTVGCEYNIATRTSFKLPKRFDLAFALPVWVIEQMKKFIDDDVTEFYLELTTDQPIAFSFGQEACETAIPFDWTAGHTQEALTTQWYEVDIAPVLANEQQIKLTLTNHSNQTAWVASLVSLDCPFMVALPLAFPIPAGLSVDKVIDYSYFAATKLDHLYVGVTTDSKISIIAEAQSAEASSTDQQGCANATLLKNGEKYTHPAGTSWYKVDGSFFANMSSLPTFRFATVSGETTKVTVGATVGCEYNIATKGTVNVPGGIDLSLRVPSFIFKVLKQFVRDDINEFYVQISTDKSIDFAIDTTTTTEDLTACLDAIDLVVTDSMTIDLAANTDQWYRVDLSALKGTNKDLAVKVVNPSDASVNVEVEVSTVCPVVASVIKEATVPASLNVTKVITAEQIAKLFEKYPDLVYYVRVSTSGDLHAEISEYIPPVDGCADAIEYVWGTDLEVNANEEGWYKLAIVDLRNQDCNIKLTVKNNAADTVTADVAIYETCPIDIPLVSMDDLAIAPTTTRVEEVSADYLPDDVDTVYLHIKPTGKLIVNVSTNCVPDPVVEFAYDTISALICDNSEYISPVSKAAHLISSANASSLTWNDTVHVHATLDSVYTFMITPIVAPQVMTDSLLETIYGTMPLLTPGKVANVDATLIMDYYHANDTESIADVIDVAWKTSTVDCNATTHVMTLVVKDDCGNEITTTHSFPVDVHPTGEMEYAMICDGEDYRWNGQRYDSTGVYSITIQDINGCDSVATLNLTVLPATQFITETKVVCYGESYTWNGQVCDQSREYSHTVKNALACDSIVYTLQLTVLPQPVEVVEDTVLCHGEHIIWHNMACDATRTYTYESTNQYDCVDTIFTLNVKVLPETIEKEEHVVRCQGETFTWKDGNSYSSTIYGPTYSEQFVGYHCDSVIYTLDLSFIEDTEYRNAYFCHGKSYTLNLPDKDTTFTQEGIYTLEIGSCGKLILNLSEYDSIPVTHEYKTICYGQSFEWNHMFIDGFATNDYTYTTHQGTNGCDSTAVLHVTVLPQAVTLPVEKHTMCYGETYKWNAQEYKVSGEYTYVENNYLGCDSIIHTLNLTVLPAVVGAVEDVKICQGESYTWHGNAYNASGKYEWTQKDINGCDSVITLNLTVLPAPQNSTDLATICEGDSVVWNGATYSQSGVYTTTLQDANGCDYQSTLELVVLTQGQDTVLDKTICYGETYSWYGVTYSTSGTYTDSLDACGATMTLNLTVLPQVQASVENVTICHGESYTWNGAVYSTAGQFTQTLKDANGCDSVATLNLTVLPATLYEDTQETICYGETYTWIDGVTYDQTASVTYNVPFAGTQCDSLVATLSLTVLPETLYEVTNDTICHGETYTWIDGVTYQHSVSGLVYKVPFASTQCDSLVAALNLTVLPAPQNSTELATICEGDSVVWNGATYSQSGVYTITLQDANGCDYQSTLELVVLTQGQDTVLDKTICYGETYSWYGVTYSTSGTYTDSLDACGATMTLNLTVLPQVQASVENVTICHGESYTWNGTTYYSSVSTTATLQDVNGCDSVASLNLVVMPAPVVINTKETICHGETYTWPVNGVTYDQTASVTYNVPFAGTQCDSLVATLNLTILPATLYEDTQETICYGETYTWIDGVTYDQSASIIYNVPFAGTQCDSLVATLSLTVLPETLYEITNETICHGETYTWIDGVTYQHSVSGLVYKVPFASTQCDSLVATLNLTVLPAPQNSTELATICEGDSVVWNGATYSQSGVYTTTLQDANGCDYQSTLELIVLTQGQDTVLDKTICYGETYSWYGVTYSTSGTYTDSLDACGATMTLNLTVLPQVQPSVENVTICHGESYTWNGTTYYSSVSTTATLQDVNGCDSVASLNLVVMPAPVVINTKETICHGETYTWPVNGVTYDQTTSVTYNVPFAGTQCDSLINVLNLIVHPKAIEEPIKVDTICHGDVYDWNGMQCSVQKTYTHVIPNQSGCDSIIQSLYLVVREAAKPTVTNQVICFGDTYTWNNQVYNTTGQYTVTLTDAYGCDSVSTLNLLVHDEILPTNEDITICYGDTLTWNGGVYSQSGIYTVTLKSSITDCDSVVTLNLTVLPEIPATTEYMTIPYNTTYTWPVNGMTYGATGVYSATLSSTEYGCDSVVNLDLTVLPPVLQYEYKTIEDFVCDGTGYEDYITKEQHIISSLVTSTQTWQDTVHVNLELDSIYVFKITPIVAPAKMTDATLATIFGTMPILTPGMMPNVDIAAIKNYYDMNDNDTISDVTKVSWIAASVPCGATTHTMTLVVEDECDNILKTEHIFPVAEIVEATPEEVTICHGETFQWNANNMIYSETNVYKDTLQSAITGCDSIIVTLNLTVRPEIITVVDTTVCRPYNARPGQPIYVWREARKTYTQSAKDTVVFVSNVTGCDSTVILNLTINEPVISDTIVTLCYGETYDWNGKTYDASGDYTINLTSATGCDSIATLHLTIFPETKDTEETVTLCYGETYDWNGKTYDASGDYSITLQDANGCDYTATLHLTIFPETKDTEETVTLCYGETYDWNGKTYDASGDYSITLQDANGCDYTATLHLTIFPETKDTEETVTLCYGETYDWNGKTYDASGDYSITLQDANGCDYTATLHLTIFPETKDTEETVTLCYGETYDWNGKTYDASGDYSITLQDANGCDYTATLHLTIFPETKDTEETVTLCYGETYDWNGKTYDASGDYSITLQDANGCDYTATLHLTIFPETKDTEETVTLCYGETYDWNGKTYDASGDYSITLQDANGCDYTATLHLTIFPETKDTEETVTLCYGETYDWNGKTYDASGDYSITLQDANGCDYTATLHLTIFPETKDTEETVTLCYGETYDWNGKTYDASGDYSITLQDANGCDYTATLHLTIFPETKDTEETVTLCYGETYDWNGKTYDASGDYSITLQDANGCDYTATLHLTIFPETKDTEETVTLCYGETYDWNGKTYDASGDYSITLQDANGCDYTATLHLTILDEITLPNVTAEDIVAICGKAIDVTTADAIIQSHIAAYDWVESVVWEVLVDGKWVPLTSDAIDGGVEMVTIRYTILTACEDLTDTLTVVVENPNPENSEELANAPAYNKYGGRLLTLDLQYIVNEFGWNIAEEDVTWYLVVEGGDDIPQGTGYYLTTEDGAPLPAGSYYALIERPAVLESDCDVVLQTVILVVETQVGPLLAPTVARPLELIRLMNLDPNAVSTIYMYSATGELMDTFQVSDKKETTFHAAQTAGYYIVEIQTATEKVSLRYIVK